jgi:hypothetical protein
MPTPALSLLWSSSEADNRTKLNHLSSTFIPNPPARSPLAVELKDKSILFDVDKP